MKIKSPILLQLVIFCVLISCGKDDVSYNLEDYENEITIPLPQNDSTFIDSTYNNVIADSTNTNNNTDIIQKDLPLLIFDKYMDHDSSSGNVQGAASYGDYLFQFKNGSDGVYIYNLKERLFIQYLPLSHLHWHHCSNASFSNIFYQEGDEFPLIYVSGSDYQIYNHIQVYRFEKTDSGFTCNQVQDIKLPPYNDNNLMYWTKVAMDNENCCMYIFSPYQSHITKMNIPDPHLGNLTMTDKDILDLFSVAPMTHPQCGTIRNGILYIPCGVPQWGDTNYFRIIDLNKSCDYKTYNMTEMGFNEEVEGITFYNDQLLFVLNDRNGIYTVKFRKDQ